MPSKLSKATSAFLAMAGKNKQPALVKTQKTKPATEKKKPAGKQEKKTPPKKDPLQPKLSFTKQLSNTKPPSPANNPKKTTIDDDMDDFQAPIDHGGRKRISAAATKPVANKTGGKAVPTRKPTAAEKKRQASMQEREALWENILGEKMLSQEIDEELAIIRQKTAAEAEELARESQQSTQLAGALAEGTELVDALRASKPGQRKSAHNKIMDACKFLVAYEEADTGDLFNEVFWKIHSRVSQSGVPVPTKWMQGADQFDNPIASELRRVFPPRGPKPTEKKIQNIVSKIVESLRTSNAETSDPKKGKATKASRRR